MKYPQVFLNVKKAKNFKGYHPWVMDRSVIEPTAGIDPGQVVDLLFPNGRWIGRGVYNPHSRIRVRLYHWQQSQALDQAWCCERLAAAIGLRKTWMARHQSLQAVRWVNSEGDGLSGLVVDQFGPYLVIQITALAMLNWLDEIVVWLQENLKPAGISLRIDSRLAASEGMSPREETLVGTPPCESVEVEDDGVRLQLHLASGQKTGYYLDQRANRRRAAEWMSSGPMLDVCCYLGGFSLAAAKLANPEKVTAVDSSESALAQAAENARLNEVANIEFIQADCFDALEQLQGEKRKFASVVLDPPRMAGNRGQVPAALRAYYRLNLAAVNLLQPGGMLVTCSCSGRVTRSDFSGMLASVARRSSRNIQLIETRGADFDHPIDANCPETEYLKCFICRVG